MNSYRVGSVRTVISAALLGMHWLATPAWGQVMSPSTVPQIEARNRAVAGAPDPTALQNMEPSRRLILALDTMIPFPVVGGETEAGFQDAAREFLNGSIDTTVRQLQALRDSHAEMPPVETLIAKMLNAAGQPELGRQWLEKAVVATPDHPTAFLGFARLAAAQKRITDAAALLEKSRRLIDSADWSKAQLDLFQLEFLDIQTDIHVNRQQFEEAKTCLLELKTMLVNNAAIPLRLAQIEFDLGNVDASLQNLRDAMTLSPSIRKPEVVIADWYLRKREFAESEQWITKAAGLYPDNVSVQIDHGRWLLQNESLAAAKAAVAKAAQLGGDEYVIGYLKGQIAFAERDYARSELQFEELMRLKPGDADAVNMLALSLIESEDVGKQGRALELATLNQRMYPNSPTATATLGWINYRRGRMVEAERAFQAVVASNNLAPVAAYYLATFLNQQGNFAGAKNLLDQALSSQDYFMFRQAAEELLHTVAGNLGKAPTPASSTPDKDGPGQ